MHSYLLIYEYLEPHDEATEHLIVQAKDIEDVFQQVPHRFRTPTGSSHQQLTIFRLRDPVERTTFVPVPTTPTHNWKRKNT